MLTSITPAPFRRSDAARRRRFSHAATVAILAGTIFAVLPGQAFAAVGAVLLDPAGSARTPAVLTPTFNPPMPRPSSLGVPEGPVGPRPPVATWSTPYALFSEALDGRITAQVDARPRFGPASSPDFRQASSSVAVIAVNGVAGQGCDGCAKPDLGATRIGAGTFGTGGDGTPLRSYLRFDLSGIPQDATIQSATLSLDRAGCLDTGVGCAAQGYNVELHQLDGELTSVTPAADLIRMTEPAYLASATIAPHDSASVAWDITHEIQGWVEGAVPNGGVSLQLADETPGHGGPAFAAASKSAPLTVVYTVPAITPERPLMPTQVTLKATPAGSLVSWSPATGSVPAIRWLVQATDPATGRGTESVSVCGECGSAPLPDLMAGKLYDVSVQALGVSGWGPASPTLAATVSGPTVAAATAPAPSPATPPAQPQAAVIDIPALLDRVSQLADGGGGGGGTSPLPAPTNVVAIAYNNASAQVSWTSPTGTSVVPTYDAQLIDVLNGNTVVQDQPVTGTTTTFNGLINGTRYTVRVAAVYGVVASNYVASNWFVPRGTPSAPQVSGNWLAAGVRQVTATWSPPADTGGGVADYVMTTYTAGGTPVAQTSCSACTSATQGGLSTGAQYYVTVYAQTSCCPGNPASVPRVTSSGPATPNSNTVTTATPPTAPPSVTATAGSGSVSATWPAVDSGQPGFPVTSYTASAYRSGATTPSGITTVNCPCPAPPSNVSTTIGGLSSGLSYYVTVTANDAAGSSAPTQSNTVTLDGPAPTVTESVSGGTSFARGQVMTYSVTVSNTGNITVTNFDDTPGAGVDPPPTGGAMTFDGAICTATTSPSCSWSGGTFSVSTFQVAAGGQHVITFQAVAVGVDGGCEYVPDNGVATDAAGSTAFGLSPQVCGTGLGLQSWWTPVTKTVGPQSMVAVNPANGNLAVSALDSTPIPGAGGVTLEIQRHYNSEDTGQVSVPNPFGAGWGFTYDGLAPEGLVVPAAESVTNPLDVTLVDSTGTRFTLQQQPLGTPVDVTGLAGSTAMIATLIPRRLSLDPGYNRACVDMGSQLRPGLHTQVWRYVEAATSSSANPCSPSTWSQSAVLGFGAERSDRARYELAWDGHLLDTVDGAGNEVQYRYSGGIGSGASVGSLTSVVETSSGRAFSIAYPSGSEMDVTDPAGRLTRYNLDGQGRLTTVTNPDSTTVGYAYGSCTGAGTNQLCQVTDPRGNATTFAYATSSSLSMVASVTERGGTLTTVTTGSVVNFDSAGERTQFANIDSSGRVGDIYEGGTTGSWLRHATFTWGGCSLGTDDNQLCELHRYTGSSGRADEDTLFTYNAEGRTLTEKQVDSGLNALYYTTHGYRALYVEKSGAVNAYNDTIAGGGAVTSDASGGRSDAGTLFEISDATASLTPRGNNAGSGYAPYETTIAVDDSSAVNPNLPIAAAACTPGASNPASNSGAVCETDAPSFDGGTHPHTVTRLTYTAFGAPATRTTPKAIAESGGTPPMYTYTYYGSADRDLSGHTSALGWLRGVTDPTGSYTVDAYDAAGNLARVWDANTTNAAGPGGSPATFSTGTAGFIETVHGSSYANPWRYVVSQTDQLGDRTSYTLDANGNRLTVRPPRGNAAGSSSYDTVQTFTKDDDLATSAMPVEQAAGVRTSQTYSRPGVEASQTDPNGNVAVLQRDAVNRVTARIFTRDVWPTGGFAVVPPACRQSTGADAPIPSGYILCQTATAYDGTDDVISTRNADAQTTTVYYDARHHEVRRDVPRNDGTLTTLTTERVYDADGNSVAVCSPRQYSEGGTAPSAGCPSSANYSTQDTYDTAGRLSATSVYRAELTPAGFVSTSNAYDADGNLASTTDAIGTATTTWVRDLLDRKVSMTVPRTSTSGNTTTWSYDPNGNVTAMVEPPTSANNRVTAYSYDAANRLLDTVSGANSTIAPNAGVLAANGGANVRTRNAYDADGHVVASLQPQAFAASVSSPNTAYLKRTDFDTDGRPVAAYTPRYSSTVPDVPGDNATQTTDCPTSGVTPQSVPGAPTFPGGTGVCVERYQYDHDGNRTKVLYASLSGGSPRETDYTYTNDGLQASTLSCGSLCTELWSFYDADQRQVKTHDVEGLESTKAYTADGLLSNATDSPGVNCSCSHISTYTYDANGNQLTFRDPVVNAANGATPTAQDTYWPDNLHRTHTDGAGDETDYSYDADGRTVSVLSPSAVAHEAPTNPSGTPTTTTYTQDGLPLTITEPVTGNGATVRRISYTYTPHGERATEDRATVTGTATSDAGTITSAYYDDGRLQSLTGRGGIDTQSFQYDGAGKITSATAVGFTSSSTITATYYPDEQLRTYADGTASETMGYDGEGAITYRSYATGLHTYQTGYSYDGSHRLASMTQVNPDGSWASNFTWGAMGELVRISGDNNNTETLVWDDGDRTLLNAYVTSTNGTTHQPGYQSYAYDSDRRLISKHTSTEDNSGNLTGDALQGYSYDAAGRLSQMTSNGIGGAVISLTYAWDRNSNLKSATTTQGGVTANSTNFTHNADGSMASAATTGQSPRAYSYSPAGTMTTDGCSNYVVDGFDRVSEVGAASPQGVGCASIPHLWYYYDALNRQAEHVDSMSGQHVFDAYAGFGRNVLVEHQQDAAQDLVYWLQNDGTPHHVSQFGSANGSSHHELLYSDAGGTLYTSTAGDGTLQCATLYDPMGAPLGAQSAGNPCFLGSGTIDSFLFHGTRRESSTGQDAMGVRTYDPSIGTFLQEDDYHAGPARLNLDLRTNPTNANLYLFASGDGVNHYDPTGHAGQATNGCEPGDAGCKSGVDTPSNPSGGSGNGGVANGGGHSGGGASGVSNPSPHSKTCQDACTPTCTQNCDATGGQPDISEAPSPFPVAQAAGPCQGAPPATDFWGVAQNAVITFDCLTIPPPLLPVASTLWGGTADEVQRDHDTCIRAVNGDQSANIGCEWAGVNVALMFTPGEGQLVGVGEKGVVAAEAGTKGLDIVGTTYDVVRPTQEEINPDVVAGYVRRLQAGEDVGRIETVRLPSGAEYIIDGHHRFVASMLTDIPVDRLVIDGPGPVGYSDWSQTIYSMFTPAGD